MATGPEEKGQSRERETAPTGARETQVRDEGAADQPLCVSDDIVVSQSAAPGELRWSRRETMVRAIADTLWQRNPLAFLAICAGARARGTTLLARIRERVVELEVEHGIRQ